uniref:Uncharacterized protein n=1 Tax=Chrysotila carterae TaxID=13221 RepID=A0A7S4F2B9_CHRCT
MLSRMKTEGSLGSACALRQTARGWSSCQRAPLEVWAPPAASGARAKLCRVCSAVFGRALLIPLKKRTAGLVEIGLWTRRRVRLERRARGCVLCVLMANSLIEVRGG